MNFLKRQVLFSRRENHLSHHEDFFNIVKLVTDEASNQFSPLFSENPLKHSRLKSHLCASTGVYSLLLLITHLRLLRASRSRNLSSLFAYRATSSPFYAHNKAPPKLPGHLCASTGVCSLLLLITHLRLLRASRSRNLSSLFAYRATSSPFYAHNKAPPKLPRHLCASTGVLEVPGVGELHEFCFF